MEKMVKTKYLFTQPQSSLMLFNVSFLMAAFYLLNVVRERIFYVVLIESDKCLRARFAVLNTIPINN